MTKKMLNIKDLHVSYGGINALRGIDIDVDEGQIVTIIGSNGAGKSSMLNAISGMVKYSGDITYKGEAPVSYTHLDVYKRQPCRCKRLRRFS